jgi:hypothetical protein
LTTREWFSHTIVDSNLIEQNSYYGEYKNMVQKKVQQRRPGGKGQIIKGRLQGINTGDNYSSTGNTRSEKTRAYFCRQVDQSRKHRIRQGRNNKATHLPHNNTSRRLPYTPCKNYCPSAAGAADYMINLGMSLYPPGRNIRRTHKPLVAAAVADSQADHHSPAGTTAAAAEGSSLDQAVPLITGTLINDTGAKTSTESRTLRGIILRLLLLTLVVVIFVRHEDMERAREGVLRFQSRRTYKCKFPQCHAPTRTSRSSLMLRYCSSWSFECDV